ncbi:ATP-binding cassette domain-containing protein [Sulfitobacter aestuariivivens]|uniref:ATP-binding cassette domain-containing protein n=1 Tax=Sulfitobacter aestuariivivens TaxID=2766981 RepID=A0A927HCJ8_9RHOB|nr:ATP-binding cassette domain-containing protein [Sulfitobacter aestuariivivens]MBD3662632.1 ATP-binding cassette domain-containing protein [Sulfitobacter aestuariivivens]
MTNTPAFTLTIANGNQGRIVPVNKEASANSASNRFANRIHARATLAATYAGILGVEAVPRDLVESIGSAIREGASAGEDARAIAQGLTGLGLSAETVRVDGLRAEFWPALAYMTSGQVLLVLGQSRGDLIVFDKTCPDNRAYVPLRDFEPFFAGILVRAETPLEKVAETHKTESAAPHWFWGQFTRFRRQLGEVALGSFVANLLAVAVALFSLQVYDRVIPHQSEATLWVLAAGAALALLMEAFIKIARAQMMDGAGRQIELSVLHILMNRILGMRSDTKDRAPNEVFSAMREFGSVREFFTASTIGTIADIPFIFVFLFLVASIAGNVVWVLVLGGILMVVPGFFLQRKMIRLTQETQGASAKSSRLLHEAIFELDTLKTQRGEDRVLRLWNELNTLSALKSSEQRRLASTLTFWSQGVQQATYVAAVIAGTYLVFAGQFTVGSIIATGILTGRTLAPLTQLAGTMARWGNVKSALDGLESIAGGAQDADDTRTYLRRETLTGHFELRDVTFRYENDGPPTLDIKGMAIKPGQTVAVLGANGSGKSSLLKVLSGLYAPETGRVMIDGAEMSQIEPRDLRRLIGYLGQDVRLFSGTLRDNLNLTMLERDDDRLHAALDFAGLGPFVRAHHKGLDLEIKDNGAGLSIGQRQSIGWARLWLQDPKICLLDEPTAALDQMLEATLVSRLEKWMAGRTAVIATHRAPILALCERTMLIQNGRMTIDGPKDKVLSHIAGGRAA